MMLTVDGVYQGPGGPDEDRRDGFDRGGWVAPHFDEETGHSVTSVFERADACCCEPDLADLRGLLAAPRRGRSGLPRHQRPAQVRGLDHADGPGVAHTHVIDATWRQRSANSNRSPGANSRSMAAASCSAGCSSATSWTSYLEVYPVVVALGGGYSLPGPDAQPAIGRIADDAVRREAPDLSAGRPGDLRGLGEWRHAPVPGAVGRA